MSRRGLSDEDKAVWKIVTRDIKPLRKKRLAEKPLMEGKPELAPVPRKKAKTAVVPASIAAPLKAESRADKGTVARVKRGDYEVEARIDLHGMTLAQAHCKLVDFVQASFRQGLRCILVITGKGTPGAGKSTLRQEVPRWLALSELSRLILVVSSAQPKHGGEGALYLLLRRKR